MKEGIILSEEQALDLLEDVIKTWIKRHPDEWKEFQLAVAERQANLYDPKYAEGETRKMRLVGMLPVPALWKGKQDDLSDYITKVVPDFFKKDGSGIRNAFFTRFGAFRVGEKL